jgi:zinc transport system substrate-binding protein
MILMLRRHPLGAHRPLTTRGAVALAAPLAATLAITGCGSAGQAGSGTSGAAIDVVAAFYPLEYLAERVGGEAVNVSGLVEPGAEPHDLELTPRDVAQLSEAAVVVYLSGFQPAVDEAVTGQAPEAGLDVAAAARLDLTYRPIETGDGAAPVTDPHFWLDPTRLADVGDALAARLGEIDPARAPTFAANAVALRTDLEALDAQFAAGLADCVQPRLVTSHTAFGYLAQRYGLEQVGIAGLDPEEEPQPQALAEAADVVRRYDVRTIYAETLVSPRIAETVAAETGAQVRVLDPIEGLTEESAGSDYLEVMRANLAVLTGGQGCG